MGLNPAGIAAALPESFAPFASSMRPVRPVSSRPPTSRVV